MISLYIDIIHKKDIGKQYIYHELVGIHEFTFMYALYKAEHFSCWDPSDV